MDSFYDTNIKFDIIFCRNVLIYFEKEVQVQVIKKLYDRLNTGGYLFIGHSESLMGMDLKLQTLKPTIYKKL